MKAQLARMKPPLALLAATMLASVSLVSVTLASAAMPAATSTLRRPETDSPDEMVTGPTSTLPPRDSDAGEPRFVRLSVNVALDVADALKTLTRRRGITATEGVRRAIAVWKLVEDEKDAGNRVQIVDPKTGDARQLVLL